MGKLLGKYIDLESIYDSAFSGNFNALTINIRKNKIDSLHHHCPDCRGSSCCMYNFCDISGVVARRDRAKFAFRHLQRRTASGVFISVST